MHDHNVVGVDVLPCSTADYVGDVRSTSLMGRIISERKIEVIVHTAGLHAPHVGKRPDGEFYDINVLATEQLFHTAARKGLKHFIYTSTTALYGFASNVADRAAWLTEDVPPLPRSIYHRTKFMAEKGIEKLSHRLSIPVTVLRMSRCFPESADLMAVYRLNRGIDPRDVARAHACAVEFHPQKGFRRYIISGLTPFEPSDCVSLFNNADEIITHRLPDLAEEFSRRGWILPKRLDRVYDSTLAQTELGWHPDHGFKSVLSLLDAGIAETLPVRKSATYI
jgi:UDP-glucose 4-epimerase